MWVLFRDSFSRFTSLYKSITNDLVLLRVLVAQLIERPPGVLKVVSSNPVTACSECFFFLIIVSLQKKTEGSIYSFKPVPKVVVID